MLEKKNSGLKPGIVYIPYIPVELASVSISNFNTKLGIKSRYALNNVNPSLFGYIRTTNLIRKMKIEKIFKIENPTD